MFSYMFLLFFYVNICLSGVSRKPGYIVFFWEMHLSLPKTVRKGLSRSELRPSCVGLTENRLVLRGLTSEGPPHRPGLGLHRLCPAGPPRDDAGGGRREESEGVSIHNR